jgi:hypothetical protein
MQVKALLRYSLGIRTGDLEEGKNMEGALMFQTPDFSSASPL